ncbi:MAG: ABC transporter permease [Actinomycetota bacterium]
MRDALAVEFLKVRRSPVTWVTGILMVVLCPALCVAFVSVVEGSGEGSLLAAKVQALVSGTGWVAYAGLLHQFAATALFVGFGVVVIWCFGREFSDRTVGSLFDLPVSRGSIATAKIVVIVGWGVAVSVVLVVLATALGAEVLGRPDGPALGEMVKLLGVAALTALVTLPLALPASVGRGYLPGIGVMVLLLISAQVAVLFGSGAWYPIAAPGLWAVSGQREAIRVTALQLSLVPLTAIAGWAVTARWWSRFELG